MFWPNEEWASEVKMASEVIGGQQMNCPLRDFVSFMEYSRHDAGILMRQEIVDQTKRLTSMLIPYSLVSAIGVGLASCLFLLVFYTASVWTDEVQDGLEEFYGKPGTLIIAGGGNLPESIPSHFCKLAGSSNARLVVIPSYDATPSEERAIVREWRRRKVATIDVSRCRSRDDSASVSLASKIRQATGVWFTGGQQAITVEYYSGTAVERNSGASWNAAASLEAHLPVPQSCHGS